MKKQTYVDKSAVELKRVFVVGCPRSGTTWVTLLLAQHPVVTAFQHSKFFHYLRSLEKWWELKENGQQRPVPILLADEFYKLCHNFARDVFNKVAAREPAAQVVVDKTPENVGISDSILKVFPGAYFIHVIRDPRSVFSSLRSAGNWAAPWEFPTKAADGAKIWCSAINKGQKIKNATDRYLEVRYESLHETGPETLNQMYKWLGLPSDLEMCKQNLAACKISKARKEVKMPNGFFRKGEKESWREELSASEVRLVEHIACGLMGDLGYKRISKPYRYQPIRLQLQKGPEWILTNIVLASQALLRRLRGREYDNPELVIY